MIFRLFMMTDNAAFEDEGELPRILRKVADDIERGLDIHMYQTIFDINGNDVGQYALKEVSAG